MDEPPPPARIGGQMIGESAAARLAGFTAKGAYAAAGLAFALALSGCPWGAELENGDRFPSGGTGGSGTGGPPPGTGGKAGYAGAGAAGAAGTVSECVTDALTSNCGRPGCHSVALQWADLTLLDPGTIADQMVGMVATHGDIDCAAPGELYRECTPAELSANCPSDALLIDPVDFDQSWVVRKMTPGFSGCGAEMPAPPGNSAASHWSEERRQCLLEFFRSLAASP
jgi:hypothetical protein